MSFFTALFSGYKKSAALLTPPDGMRETDIALESSTCTGETVIGFRSKADFMKYIALPSLFAHILHRFLPFRTFSLQSAKWVL